VVGRPYLEVIRHPRLNEIITEVLSNGTAASTEINLRTGSEQTFQVQASPLAQGSDPTPGLVLVFHDITDLRRLEQVRKDLVANVSHELRTPLTAIKGYAEALQDASQDDPAQRHRFLEIIGTHTDHLNLIITDLLLLSKIESGQIPLTLEPVEIPALVERTMGLLRHAIKRKQHKIVTDLPDRLPPALGDEERLGQVLTNLLDNAVKYTPDHGTITVTGAVVQEMIEICVEDTGIGIPPKDLPRIFERFYRVDKARSRELGGTGLGLAIVKHLVEGHRGSVTVENLPTQGTRFRVRLPMSTTLSFSQPVKETD
jgi:two-component system, OmpR family, phosphate regulon sensor histidine kinase PhoR